MQKIEVEIQKKLVQPIVQCTSSTTKNCHEAQDSPEEYFKGNEYLEIYILKANTSRHLIINPALGLYRPLCSIEGV